MTVINGTNSWVTYVKGSMNLVISVPHGGQLKLEQIPNRKGPNVCFDNDLHTEIIAQFLQSHFKDMGYEPHMIINDVHRSKVDQNRPMDQACLGNPDAEIAYQDYHGFIEKALDEFSKPALLIDLHGQSHQEDWIEVVFGVKPDSLDAGNYDVDTFTMKALCTRKSISAHEAINGESSFGAFLSNGGYHAVPCPKNPAPQGGGYYSGGYTVLNYSKKYGPKGIDCLQIEVAKSLRSVHTAVISSFAKDLAQIILEYMRKHEYL